jgi:hypothetical protein
MVFRPNGLPDFHARLHDEGRGALRQNWPQAQRPQHCAYRNIRFNMDAENRRDKFAPPSHLQTVGPDELRDVLTGSGDLPL